MDEQRERGYIAILRQELVPALGCTEPIAIAYAAAKARQTLGIFPESIEMCCSGNIIKNVKGVVVPNSGGMRGVDAAAVLGVVGGNADRELEVLEEIKPEHIEQTRQLVDSGFFSCQLQENVENLYIVATVRAGEHSASVTIVNRHTLITEIVKDGKVIYENKIRTAEPQVKAKWDLTVTDILDFIRTVDIANVKDLLDRQIKLNTTIAQAGLNGNYGTSIGQTLLETMGDDVSIRAQAMAAAGSDARMGGCSLPVVINSGSGNQGMTVSLPVLEFAKEWKVSEDTLYRALLLSNLLSIHLKHFIGSLSAFCGAVTAACGAGAAITYMAGGTDEQIGNTVINTVANVGGIICDGAKSSCAAKIASAVNAAILAHNLSMKNRAFQPGEGIIQKDVESTIKSIGYVGRVGMKETDIEILNIMMDHIKL